MKSVRYLHDERNDMEQYTVRQVRSLLGLSIPKMAEKMNMHPQTYRNKELGIRKWYFDETIKLSEISSIDKDKIIFDK